LWHECMLTSVCLMFFLSYVKCNCAWVHCATRYNRNV